MSQYDEQLPEDIRDIAARLSAARVTPTALELDELRRRVRGRAARAGRARQRRGLARVLRMNFVAVALTLGLTLSSGVGVVLACASLGPGGGGSWSWPSPPKNASWCQYHGPWTYSYSWKTKHSTLTVDWLWDCKHLTVHIGCGERYGFKWDTGGWNDVDLTSYTSTAPNLNSGLTIDTDGSTFVLTSDGTTVHATASNSPTSTVSFNANGGTGSMAAETTNAPAALTSDSFTRTGYTFNGWNTAANGSGTAYANGATYDFTANTTLYAQWKANPSFTVTFNANSGSGSMAAETKNVPTALTSDTFTRSGYTFNGWNTAANGSGTAYGNGATYAFTANTTLYAQWKANPSFTVTFNANSGTGTMAAETKNVPTVLTSDTFTRSGYTFNGWNTAANGSGTAYGNGATYAFTANVTLYAQWHH